MEQIVSNSNKAKWYEYVFLLFIILWSGGGFTYGLFPAWMIVFFPIVGYFFINKRLRFKTGEIIILATILVVLFLQMMKFNGDIKSIVRPYISVIVCAMLAHLLGNNFSKLYVNIIYTVSAICLTLWCICQIPAGLDVLRSLASQMPLLGWDNIEDSTNIVDTLYIFSIPQSFDGIIRNSGPFWEPGRFTIYITLALAINLFNNEESLLSKRNVILILTNITTFSTTGYLAMGVLLIGYVFCSDIKLHKKFIIGTILACLAVYVSNLDFMSDKIIQQSSDNSTWSRFGAMAYHWSQIEESPLIGYGPYLKNAFIEDLLSSPNGLTDLIRYYGIPLSIVLYVLLYRGTILYIGQTSKNRNTIVFIVLIILCFSQTITYSPFFYLLYFFTFNKYDQKNRRALHIQFS